MSRSLVISFAVLFLVVAAIPASEQKARKQRNRSLLIDSFTSSSRRIEVCTFPNTQVLPPPEVELLVNATDPDGDSLNYEYSTKEGTISGQGKLVLWDLRGLPRGPHEVRVTVTDGKGGKTNGVVTITTVDAGVCDPPRPPCPQIRISCPGEEDKSQPFTFSALVLEGEVKPYTPPSFHWKLNAGRIVKGQNSREIKVTATGADGFDSITATVQVGGFDPSCHTTASCTTKLLTKP